MTETIDSGTPVGPSRRWLAPRHAPPVISFAQNGEDIRLLRIFGDIERGTYVDVGAADPTIDNVTKVFADMGWTGLNIEPGPDFDALEAARPGDHNVRCLVGSDDSQPATLYVTRPQLGWSTMSSEHVATIRDAVESIEEVELPVRRLDDLIHDHLGPTTIHLVKIDVEGAEDDVLSSFDLERWRPLCVIVEAVETFSREPTDHRFAHHFAAAGYVDAAFDGLNRFYLRDDLEHLADVLAYPLSPMDNAVPYAVAEGQHHLEQQRRQLEEEHRKALEHAQWEHGLAIDEQAQAHRDEMDALREELIARREEAATVIERLGQVTTPQPDPAVLSTHIVDLEAHLHLAKVELEEVYQSQTWRAGRGVRKIGLGAKHLPRRAVGLARRIGATRLHAVDTDRNGDVIDPSTAFRQTLTSGAHWSFPPPEPTDPAADDGGVGLLGTDPHVLEGEHRSEVIEELDRHLALGADEFESFSPEDGLDRAALVDLRLALSLPTPEAGRVGPADQPIALFDARPLQDINFRNRGIGRVAREALRALIDVEVVLLVHPLLPSPDDADLAMASRVVDRVHELDLTAVDLYVNPAPMTGPIGPIRPILADPRLLKLGIIYDFIPAEFPATYLRTTRQRATYQAALESLRCYHHLVADSVDAAEKGRLRLGSDHTVGVIGAPDLLRQGRGARAVQGLPRRFVFAPLGADRRKNIPAAIAVTAALADPTLDLIVLSHMHDDQRDELDDLCRRCGFDPTRLHVVSGLSDEGLRWIYRNARVCLVPSFAEGFSLPVVEAVGQNTPVVVSDIAVHRELVGHGPWAAPADDIDALVSATQHVLRHRNEVLDAQRRAVGDTPEPRNFRARVSGAVAATIAETRHGQPAPDRLGTSDRVVRSRPRTRPRIAMISPWPPERSGIASYNAFVMPELLERVDVDLYVNRLDGVDREPDDRLRILPNTAGALSVAESDARVSILGNSHFHIPAMEHLRAFGGAAVLHDNRLIELHTIWEGTDRAAQLLQLDGADVTSDDVPRLIAQPADLPRLGTGEIARLAHPLMVHSPALARRIEDETGIACIVLPFCQNRLPSTARVTATEIDTARRKLGLSPEVHHIATFGIADRQTKGTHVIVEAMAWLRQWGHEVHLHQIGGSNPVELAALRDAAARAGVADRVAFHPWVSGDDFDRFQLAVDAAVQLRLGPAGQISGAIADCIAFGVPTVGSEWIADDLESPWFVRRVPSAAVSPLLVAEALADILGHRRSKTDAIDAERARYLSVRSPAAYADALVAGLGLA